MKILVDQHIAPDGHLESSHLASDDEGTRTLRLVVVRGDGAEAREVASRIVPVALLRGIFRRYGKPLADEVELVGARVELEDGSSLVALRHLARYDVIARDWLVLVAPGAEPLAELSTSVTAALKHLLEASERAGS